MYVETVNSTETAKTTQLGKLRAEAEHANKVVASFFADPIALQQHEQFLTHQYYAYYDKFRNQVRIISKTEENWVIHCDVETIYGCYRAAYAIKERLPITLSEKEVKLSRAAEFLRSWVSECEKHLGHTV